MNTLSTQKTRLVNNFIIISPPSLRPLIKIHSPPASKQEEKPISDEQKGSQAKLSEHPSIRNSGRRKRYPKDDYQKNITINVVKCCIREIVSKKYRRLIEKRCVRRGLSYESLVRMVGPILKQVVISLGDLKKMLTSGDDDEIKLKGMFSWFLQWYLRNRYMHYLLNEGKMNHKERYIDYKNKYMLYLLNQTKQGNEGEQSPKQEELQFSNEVKIEE